jgi:hypothetical protein
VSQRRPPTEPPASKWLRSRARAETLAGAVIALLLGGIFILAAAAALWRLA